MDRDVLVVSELCGDGRRGRPFSFGDIMNETPGQSSIGRSIFALFAGFVVVVGLSIGADAAMHGAGIFPPISQPMSDQLFLLATVYRVVFGIAGSYVTARLAPNRPMQHALLGGLVGIVLSIVGAVTTWNPRSRVWTSLVPYRAGCARPAAIVAGRIPARKAAACQFGRVTLLALTPTATRRAWPQRNLAVRLLHGRLSHHARTYAPFQPC